MTNGSMRLLVEIDELFGFVEMSPPSDYLAFLLKRNGYTFKDPRPSVNAGPHVVHVEHLFGLNKPRSIDLFFVNREYSEDIPPRSILIGSLLEHQLLFLSVNKDISGVYVYDHSCLLSGSCDSLNTYRVADGFTDLLGNISRLDLIR